MRRVHRLVPAGAPVAVGIDHRIAVGVVGTHDADVPTAPAAKHDHTADAAFAGWRAYARPSTRFPQGSPLRARDVEVVGEIAAAAERGWATARQALVFDMAKMAVLRGTVRVMLR